MAKDLTPDRVDVHQGGYNLTLFCGPATVGPDPRCLNLGVIADLSPGGNHTVRTHVHLSVRDTKQLIARLQRFVDYTEGNADDPVLEW